MMQEKVLLHLHRKQRVRVMRALVSPLAAREALHVTQVAGALQLLQQKLESPQRHGSDGKVLMQCHAVKSKPRG